MDFSPETYEAADRFFSQQWQRGLIPGYLGKPGADGTFEFFVAGNPGRQYVRIWRGDEVSVTTCTNDRAPLEPNNLVWLRRFHGELIVERSDPSTARTLWGDNVGAAGVPYYVTLHENDLVPGARLLDGLLRASVRTDVTRLHIESFEYDGGRYESDPAGATDPDVSGDYPVTTDEYGIIGVYLDPSDGSINTFAGEHHAALADFAYDDRDNVPDSMVPIGAVLVQEGDGISEANTFFDWRIHYSIKGAGGGSFTGDATDVPYTPTTGGDWTEGEPSEVGGALDTLAARVSGGASIDGWLPYAYPIMYTHDAEFSISQSLPAGGGSAAIPFALAAPMLLESVTILQVSTSSERTWGWDLYWQENNTGDSGENTLARLAACSANDTFTPATALQRTLSAGSAPVSLDAGLYWLVIQNRHASNTFELALHEVNNFARSGWQYKTTSNPNGATLDFVAATWGKSSEIPAARLNGRVFGQTTAF